MPDADNEAVKRTKENLEKRVIYDRVLKRYGDRIWQGIKDKLSKDDLLDMEKRVDQVVDAILQEWI